MVVNRGIYLKPVTEPCRIIVLAMSSRNAYLKPEERAVAPLVYKVLTAVAAEMKAGGSAGAATARGKQELLKAGFARIDYLDVVDAATLKTIERAEAPARVAAAAFLGQTRLIDNVPV